VEEVHRQPKLWKESIEMSRYTAGYVLVAGLMVTVFGIGVCSLATGTTVTPDKDWMVDLINYAGAASAISGIAMFFFGASRFSKPE
jgi:hypothetical protein